VGNAGGARRGVFQGGFIAVISTARLCAPRRKLVRRQIAQTAVRTFFVVFHSPLLDLALGIEQILKPTYVQTLFPQPSVKALHPRILCRLARLNLDQLDSPFETPRQKMTAAELRAIVHADRAGHSRV